MTGRTATLSFDRHLPVPVATLWEVWSAPAARAIWAPPVPEASVEFVEAETRLGGREVSICRVEGHADILAEGLWLDLMPPLRSVNSEVISCEGVRQSAALVTADLAAEGAGSRIALTVQLSSLAEDMSAGYRQGFGAGLDNLADLAGRTMVLDRVIAAPRDVVWGAWFNADTMPTWWGPDGFSCRTRRIDLRAGGEWVFDMIGPDGTEYPNHHLYGEVRDGSRIAYAMLWGENGPKHADAWVSFADEGEATRITLAMALSTAEAYAEAKGFGAEALGLQTLGKLARSVGAE
jgi:uncharacterized protein YndB with AHSA1/START domain